jgi:hypothetical protein
MMDEVTGLIVSTLKRKRDLDRDKLQANNMVNYEAWLIDAVELLLQAELMRRASK